MNDCELNRQMLTTKSTILIENGNSHIFTLKGIINLITTSLQHCLYSSTIQVSVNISVFGLTVSIRFEDKLIGLILLDVDPWVKWSSLKLFFSISKCLTASYLI